MYAACAAVIEWHQNIAVAALASSSQESSGVCSGSAVQHMLLSCIWTDRNSPPSLPHTLCLRLPVWWCVSAGPAFPSSENTSYDKLFDVLSQTGRKVPSCMVDREFAIGKHATGQHSIHAAAAAPVLAGGRGHLTGPPGPACMTLCVQHRCCVCVMLL